MSFYHKSTPISVQALPPSASYPMPDASGASNARPHRRKQSTHHIPRAPNAFIVFRSHFYSNILGTQTGGDQRNVSRVAGAAWHGLTLEEKRAWHARAVEARQAHAVRYPEYRFTPSPRELEMTGRQRRRPGPVPPGEVEKERIKQKCARVAGLYLEDKEKNKEKMLQEMRSVDEMVNPHRTWKGFEDEASSRMEDGPSVLQRHDYEESSNPTTTRLPSFWEGFGCILDNDEHLYHPSISQFCHLPPVHLAEHHIAREGCVTDGARDDFDIEVEETEGTLLLPSSAPGFYRCRSNDALCGPDSRL